MKKMLFSLALGAALAMGSAASACDSMKHEEKVELKSDKDSKVSSKTLKSKTTKSASASKKDASGKAKL